MSILDIIGQNLGIEDLTNLEMFANNVADVESSGGKNTISDLSSARGIYQFLTQGENNAFQTALNRTETMYANKGDVPEYIQEARQHNDPNKLTEAQQQDVFFANLYQQQGTDDLFQKIAGGDMQAGVDLFAQYHHTNPKIANDPVVLQKFGIDETPGFFSGILSTVKDLFGFEEGGRVPFKKGGRVGFQNGGQTYQQLVDRIIESYPEGEAQTIQRPSPQVEALQSVFGPQLATFLGTPIDATGGTNIFGQTYGSFLPTAADQNIIQQRAVDAALAQAGLGTAKFDDTGRLVGGAARTPGGVAGFQPFLRDATTAAQNIAAAAAAGQGAGQTQLQNLADQANLAGLAAIAGQDVGAPGITAAQNIADRIEAQAIAGQQAAQPFLDRAAQLAEPSAIGDFMSPYQQQVIDTTRQELERQLQAQQAQLGASAGTAFGGGRFGLAEGELAATGARGIAQTLAGLRQTGFEQARQAAANALQQQLQLGQAAQGQAGQNLALLGSGLQAQLAGSTAAQQQAGQNVGLLGQTGQMQLGTAQGLQQQAAQNVGLNQAALAGQTGLASLQPQLASQNIGLLGQIGAQQQQQQQALAETGQQGAQMIALMPQQQLGFFGSQLTGLGGGAAYPTTYSFSPGGGGPSPLMQVLGLGGSLLGGAVGLGSLFNTGGGQPRII